MIKVEAEYGQAGGERLRMDVYHLAEKTHRRRPGIIFVHGGGWQEGDKDGYADKASEMAARGYVCASVNYRLSPRHRYPAALDDVQRAVRWLRQQAETYNLDPARIGAIGDSAGGHLASLLGVRDTRDNSDPQLANLSSRVSCVVNYYGRADLTLDPTSANHTDFRFDFIGAGKEEALETYQDASPIFHVDDRTAPFFIAQGTADEQVEPIQSQSFFAALQQAGVESSLLSLAGQGHGFEGASANIAWNAAKAFFEYHLRPE